MDEPQVLSALHTEVRCLDRWRVRFTQLGDRAESWPLSFRKGPTCLHPFRQQVAALACKLFPLTGSWPPVVRRPFLPTRWSWKLL